MCANEATNVLLTNACEPISGFGSSIAIANCGTSDAYNYGYGNVISEKYVPFLLDIELLSRVSYCSVYSTWNDNACSQLMETNGNINGACEVTGGSTSTKYDWPYAYNYATNDCSGTASAPISISFSCTAGSIGDDYWGGPAGYSSTQYNAADARVITSVGVIVASLFAVAMQLW